jgi:hypothetical protein
MQSAGTSCCILVDAVRVILCRESLLQVRNTTRNDFEKLYLYETSHVHDTNSKRVPVLVTWAGPSDGTVHFAVLGLQPKVR